MISLQDFRDVVSIYGKSKPTPVLLKEYLPTKNCKCKEPACDGKRTHLFDALTEALYEFMVVDKNKNMELIHKHLCGDDVDVTRNNLILPQVAVQQGDTFYGRSNAKTGRFLRRLNQEDFLSTGQYTDDPVTGRVPSTVIDNMFNKHQIQIRLLGPAGIDSYINRDMKSILMLFRMVAKPASIFNPYTFATILKTEFSGDTLFTPVMGWNSYQVAFYNSDFKHYVATDVIPNVCDNSNTLHQMWVDNDSLFVEEGEDKTIDTYCCPSEKLQERHGFIDKYRDSVDAILFSPPYFNLEMYPGQEQSTSNYGDYQQWLKEYWEETIIMCKQVMKTGAKLGFVISNTVADECPSDISGDMARIVEKHLTPVDHKYIEWSNVSTGRQKSNKDNSTSAEDLWMYVK